MTRRQRSIAALPPTQQDNWLKRSVSIDPTVGSRSNFLHEFSEAIFNGLAWNRKTQPRRPVRAIPLTRRECRVKRFISTDPTVGSRSNFFHEFPEAVFDGRRRPIAALPPTPQENRLKRFVSIDPTIGSRFIFFMSFRRLFSMETHGIGKTRPRRPVGAIPPTGTEY